MGTISWQKLLFSTLRHLAQSSVSSRALIYIYIYRESSLSESEIPLFYVNYYFIPNDLFSSTKVDSNFYNFIIFLFSIYHFCVEIILIFEEEVWLTFRFDKIISTFNPLVPFRLRRKLILWIIIHFHRIFFVWAHFSFFLLLLLYCHYILYRKIIFHRVAWNY